MISKTRKYILLIALLIASCSQSKPAKIVLKGDKEYHKGSKNNRIYHAKSLHKKNVKNSSKIAKKNSSKNNFTDEEKSDNLSSKNGDFIIVAEGENPYAIAQKYSTSVRDIIDVNDLEPPYILRVGDKLILPTTKYHTVQEGDNLYKISRMYDMNINELIEINNLKEPYSIATGSKLKISNVILAQKNIDKAVSTKKKVEEADLALDDSKNNLSANKDDNKGNVIADNAKIVHKDNKFTWPVVGKIISNFGPKSGGLYNDGINIKAKESTPVKASEDGMVAYVGNELRGYGNLIIVKHYGGWISAYGHLKEAKVKIGSKVKKGEDIALVGATGNVSSPQLYFGIRKGREAVNPQSYLGLN